MPTDARVGECIPSVDEAIWKRMMLLLRHLYRLREFDGAIPWESLMQHSKGFGKEAAGWIFEDWKTHLENGSDKIRFEHWIDRHHQIQNMRSVHGHSGGLRIDPKLQSNVLIPYGWTDYLYHVGLYVSLEGFL